MKKEFPKVGFGTWEITGENVKMAIESALKSGYKHIDTAQIYNNEYQIGEVLKDKDISNLFITSKIWPLNYKYHTYKSLKDSLKRLAINKIDMMLLHAPLPKEKWDDVIIAYKELMKARKEGLVDYIGVSNFTVDIIEYIKDKTGEYPYVNQIICSPTAFLKDIEIFCKEKGIKLTAYSTLRSYFNPNIWYEGSGMDNSQKKYIDSLALKYNKNVGQVLSKWALQCGYHIIPKSLKPERIKTNIMLDDFNLTDDEVKKLRTWNIYDSQKMFKNFSSKLDNYPSYDEAMQKGLLFNNNFEK